MNREQHADGFRVYTPSVLRLYDWYVLGFSNRLIWKCRTREMVRWYDRHVSGNHLDVGVGTGYLLDHCKFPSSNPNLTLADPNSVCLDFAAKRVARYQPKKIQIDILDSDSIPLDLKGKFGSVGLNFVLHCLPGTMESKAIVFELASQLLETGGTFFGSTIIGASETTSWRAKKLMAIYNRKGIFSNHHDRLSVLKENLQRNFSQFDCHTIGCVALFMGKK